MRKEILAKTESEANTIMSQTNYDITKITTELKFIKDSKSIDESSS